MIQSPHASKGQDVPRAPRSLCRGHWARSNSFLYGQQGPESNSIRHAVSAWHWVGADKESHSRAGFQDATSEWNPHPRISWGRKKTPLAALGEERGARFHDTPCPQADDLSVEIRSLEKKTDSSRSTAAERTSLGARARRRDAPGSIVLRERTLEKRKWVPQVAQTCTGETGTKTARIEQRELHACPRHELTRTLADTELGLLSIWCRIQIRGGPPRPSAPDLEACSSSEALRAWTPFWQLLGTPYSASAFWLPRTSAIAPSPLLP